MINLICSLMDSPAAIVGIALAGMALIVAVTILPLIPVMKAEMKRQRERQEFKMRMKQQELELKMMQQQKNKSDTDEKENFSLCPYCGTKHDTSAKNCRNCGAGL